MNKLTDEALNTAYNNIKMNTAEVDTSEIDPNINKLRWQCRRGMKELDVLLRHYLDHLYPNAHQQEQLRFEKLLSLLDDQLYDYLVGRMTHPDPLSALLIEKLRGYSSFRR